MSRPGSSKKKDLGIFTGHYLVATRGVGAIAVHVTTNPKSLGCGERQLG